MHDLKRWVVVGFDYDKAEKIINSIEQSCGKEILRKIKSKHEQRTEFVDGTLLRWIKASDNSRGHRFNKMWCNEQIDKNIFNYVIMPCYMGKLEDIIWL